MHLQRRLLVNVQILRGLAALMVAVSHLTGSLVHADLPNPLPVLDVGHFGVDLFFVVSGFIMFHTAGDDAGSTAAGRFLVRRIARVVPIYWIFTSLAFAGMIHDYGSAPISTFQRWHVLASYLFVPFRELEDQSGVFPIYAVGWTLQYEMLFYACFAASLLGAPRFRLALLSGGLLAAVLVGLAVPLPLPLSFWADPIILEFVYGMLIAWALRSGLTLRGRSVLVLALAAAAVLAWETAADVDAEDTRVLWWGLPAAALVAAAVFAPGIRHGRLARALEHLGDASYSLYLVHPAVYDAIVALSLGAVLGQRLHLRILMPTMLAGAIVAALAFYSLVERPLTRGLQRRFLGRVPVVPPAPPALTS